MHMNIKKYVWYVVLSSFTVSSFSLEVGDFVGVKIECEKEVDGAFTMQRFALF